MSWVSWGIWGIIIITLGGLYGKAWGTPAEVWSFYIMYFGQLEDIWDPEKCSKNGSLPCEYDLVWCRFMFICLVLPTFNIEILQIYFLWIVVSKHFVPKRTKIFVFLVFCVFLVFLCDFLLTSKQICIFTFFENPCFAFKNNTKSSYFTKKMIKMITI